MFAVPIAISMTPAVSPTTAIMVRGWAGRLLDIAFKSHVVLLRLDAICSTSGTHTPPIFGAPLLGAATFDSITKQFLLVHVQHATPVVAWKLSLIHTFKLK
jgi:hypothetical protein